MGTERRLAAGLLLRELVSQTPNVTVAKDTRDQQKRQGKRICRGASHWRHTSLAFLVVAGEVAWRVK